MALSGRSVPRHYLDFNATAPLRPEAREALVQALSHCGNPSSVHAEGRRARALIEEARATIAAGLATKPAEIIFTSGATEALNGLARPSRAFRRLIIGATEHAALLDGHGFAADAVSIVPVDRSGLIQPDALAAALAGAGQDTLVAIQAANNETGVIQPLAELAPMVRACGAALLCDAVQAAGRLDLAPLVALSDALVLSSHKIGGPAGAAAIVFGAEGGERFAPFIRGGGQERRRRAGTENVAAIAGFAAAFAVAEATRPAEVERLRALRDRAEAAIIASEGVAIVGAAAPRLTNTTTCLTGVPADKALISCDLAGMALSSGSACSSGKVGVSPILLAMGFDEGQARSALRISFGWASDEADCAAFCNTFPSIISALRANVKAA